MNIRLSEKHGVNPSIPTCFYCNEQKNEVVLFGRLPNDAEAGMHCGVVDMSPCEKCEDLMNQGVLLISVSSEAEMERVNRDLKLARAEYERKYGWRSDSWKREHPFNFIPDPYRTGGWVVVTDEAIERMVQPEELAEHIIRIRWCFVPDEAWDALGLPRGEVNDQNDES